MSRKADDRAWSVDELAELAQIKPRQHGAVPAFARRWDRSPVAVASKLSTLRVRRLAEDVVPARRPAFPVHRFD